MTDIWERKELPNITGSHTYRKQTEAIYEIHDALNNSALTVTSLARISKTPIPTLHKFLNDFIELGTIQPLVFEQLLLAFYKLLPGMINTTEQVNYSVDESIYFPDVIVATNDAEITKIISGHLKEETFEGVENIPLLKTTKEAQISKYNEDYYITKIVENISNDDTIFAILNSLDTINQILKTYPYHLKYKLTPKGQSLLQQMKQKEHITLTALS